MSSVNVFDDISNDLMQIVDREAGDMAVRLGSRVESKAKGILKNGDVKTQVKRGMLEYLVSVTAELGSGSESRKSIKPVKKITEINRLEKVSKTEPVKGQVSRKKIKDSESSSAIRDAAASVARKGQNGLKFLETALRQALSSEI